MFHKWVDEYMNDFSLKSASERGWATFLGSFLPDSCMYCPVSVPLLRSFGLRRIGPEDKA